VLSEERSVRSGRSVRSVYPGVGSGLNAVVGGLGQLAQIK